MKLKRWVTLVVVLSLLGAFDVYAANSNKAYKVKIIKESNANSGVYANTVNLYASNNSNPGNGNGNCNGKKGCK